MFYRELLEVVSSPFECNDEACERNKCTIHLKNAVETNQDSTVILHPHICPFDFPSAFVPSKFTIVLNFYFLI